MCLLTEPEGRARDAANAVFAENGSLRVEAGQVLPTPGAESHSSRAPTPTGGETAQGREMAETACRSMERLFLPSPALSLGTRGREGPQD